MAISDDFSGDLSKWTERISTGWTISAGQLNNGTAAGTRSALVYTDETPGADQWAKLTLVDLGPTSDVSGAVLRFENVVTPDGYWVNVRLNSSTDTYVSIVADSGVTDDISYNNPATWQNGDVLGVSVEGQDTGITINIWQNPVGADPSAWGTALFTRIIAGVKYNTANNVGIMTRNFTAAGGVYDDFVGGSLAVADLELNPEQGVFTVIGFDAQLTAGVESEPGNFWFNSINWPSPSFGTDPWWNATAGLSIQCDTGAIKLVGFDAIIEKGLSAIDFEVEQGTLTFTGFDATLEIGTTVPRDIEKAINDQSSIILGSDNLVEIQMSVKMDDTYDNHYVISRSSVHVGNAMWCRTTSGKTASGQADEILAALLAGPLDANL